MRPIKAISGAALGAVGMYLLDPERGRRRRALLRDKLAHFANASADAWGPTANDVRNRAYGTVAEAKGMLRDREQGVSDETLLARVRSELGRVVSHPRSICVEVADGRVTLSGPVLASEERRLLRHVAGVRGVKHVTNLLEVHDQPDNVPGLQGGTRREPRADIMQTYWSPTTRLVSTIAGALLTMYGAHRRGLRGTLLGALGVGLFGRAATNLEAKRLAGVGAGRRAIDIQKSITIEAPIERVFLLWTNYANFPRFMSNVREVRDLGDGRSHWKVAGPAGVELEWDAVITDYEYKKRIAWKSEPGAAVGQAGEIHFEPVGEDATRVHVRLSYNPPAGAIGHAVAKLFGADPRSEMDADLMRMKSFIETGKAPHDAARPAA